MQEQILSSDMEKRLPAVFKERMRELLGEEYPAFLDSLGAEPKRGLRVNTLKISPEEFEAEALFSLTRLPLRGTYLYSEEERPSRHPWYAAGLYYLQEPSAMLPAAVLDVRPGERVLDLCAAPGGKATALGAALSGEGLLAANDVSRPRAAALLKNLEAFGIANILVTAMQPARLPESYKGFFDAVLVDAPCSGEGMFRKDDSSIDAWTPDKTEKCAAVQRGLVRLAADMLRPGGRMVYSTCTFSPLENEAVIRYLLESCPDMQLKAIEGFDVSSGLDDKRLDRFLEKTGLKDEQYAGEGRAYGLERCARLWPHRTQGEGHFIALLEKCVVSVTGGEDSVKGESFTEVFQTPGRSGFAKRKKGSRHAGLKDDRSGKGAGIGRAERGFVEAFFTECGIKMPESWSRSLSLKGGLVFACEPDGELTKGVNVLRCGLFLGYCKKDRFEPSQSLAMALTDKEAACRVELSEGDVRLKRFLERETISPEDDDWGGPGWKLVCAGRYPVGWGKLSEKGLKCRIPAAWDLI